MDESGVESIRKSKPKHVPGYSELLKPSKVPKDSPYSVFKKADQSNFPVYNY